LAIQFIPDIAYKRDDIAGGVRFIGVLGMPAMMAEAAGILLGVAIFGAHRLLPRKQVLMVLGAFPALVCLFLTGARTFWVATLAAFLVTTWFCWKISWQMYVGGLFLSVVVLVAFVAFDFSISKEQTEKTFRPESASHLTGRVGIWERAFEKFKERPLLGYGLSATGATFMSSRTLSSSEMTRYSVSAVTMHNGYIQAFLDSGILGGALYGIIVFAALFRLLRLDVGRQFAAETFLVVFFAVSNLGESVIYTTGTFPSALFWFLAVFAFSMMKTREQYTDSTPLASAAVNAEPKVVPNL
jgi:O-antigen ligase